MSVRKVVLVPFEQYKALITKNEHSNFNNTSPTSEESEQDKSILNRELYSGGGLPSVPLHSPLENKINHHPEDLKKELTEINLKKNRQIKRKNIIKKGQFKNTALQNKKHSFFLPPPSSVVQSGGSKLFNFKSPIKNQEKKSDKNILNNIDDLIKFHWVE